MSGERLDSGFPGYTQYEPDRHIRDLFRAGDPSAHPQIAQILFLCPLVDSLFSVHFSDLFNIKIQFI